MKQIDQQKRQLPVPTANRIRTWLLGSIVTLLLLLAATMLIVPRLIDLALIKQKIQAVVAEQTGGQVDYQGIGLSYFPRPSIELRQVTLTISDLTEGKVAALRLSPKFLPLLTGDLRLARLEMDAPQLGLELPETKQKDAHPQSSMFGGLGEISTLAAGALGGLELQVNNAKLTLARNKQKLAELDGLNLHVGMAKAESDSAKATSLQAHLPQLKIYRSGKHETIKDLSLSGNVQMMGDNKLTIRLDRLILAEPSLELTGDLTLAATAPAITLNLSGANIDVDATRRSALALAGDTTPIKEIFEYLHGGRAPQISFTSHGANPSELGDLDNVLIKGRLQDGKVAIPEIDLHLTGVSGDVAIVKGVLHGAGLSARSGESVGRDGSLKIGLTKENNLFQLDLQLSADLTETQSILQRVVDAPAFVAELEMITNLQGASHGKLTLGDSLHDINAKIEIDELKLSADYQRAPLPITITQGRVAFSKKQLDLDTFSGSWGKSQFADLSCRFLWEKDLAFDIGSGRFDLDMTEIYPWLASMKGLRDRLQKVKLVTGGLELSALALKGQVNRPAEWRFTSMGAVKDLSIDTTLFPGVINFASGEFRADTQRLTFEKLQTSSQDAVLILSGGLYGFPQRLERLDLSLDGSMGPKSVEWLSNVLNVPESYAIRAPLSIDKAQISWSPDSTTSFKGLVSIEKGPAITADVDYRPEQLEINRLHIKDQYSDADIVFDLNKDEHAFKFIGKLQNETLQSLFVDQQFSSGRMEGDFTVTVPQGKQAKVTATGRLTGENLLVPVSSGDGVSIDRISLKAAGPQVKVDITKLAWKNLAWEPVDGTVFLNRDRADFRLARAKLCGINSLGLISLIGDQISLDLTLEGKNLDVATSYTCLTEGRVKATGSLDFSSRITAKGQMDELVKSLKGPLQMTLSNGVIKQDKLVARILAVLNVTEIVRGRLPDLRSTGFAYTTMTLQGEFQNGELNIHRFFMDGETLDLIGYGEIRLEDEALDVQLLAAPFKTVDSIVKIIPGVNYLLAGSLVAIPISITGTLDNPKVEVMSVSAVSSSLYNLAERTIMSPFKLIEKINPWGKRNSK